MTNTPVLLLIDKFLEESGPLVKVKDRATFEKLAVDLKAKIETLFKGSPRKAVYLDPPKQR